MSDVLSTLREACARVADQAQQVRVNRDLVPAYAAQLPGPGDPAGPDPAVHPGLGTREQQAAYWLTLDAINFGSGWFPTLRKRRGRSGYLTVAGGLRDRFRARGPWSAEALARITPVQVAEALGQDPGHELMGLFAESLRDVGRRVAREHSGSFVSVVDRAGGSALALVEALARWRSFKDSSRYGQLEIPFLKRAQIAAADLHRARLASFEDLYRLTMFADNLVPHVLRLDGVLEFSPALVRRIEHEEVIAHGSPEEVEIRACALHAVELIAAARPGTRAADIDQTLWLRGQGPRYKAVPRHRSRCTAY